MTLITQCPKCKTAFRVSDAQLAAARGAVRCGACLTVFVATKHQIEPAETTPPEPPRAPQPAGDPMFTIVAGGDEDELHEDALEAALQEIGASARKPAPKPAPRPTYPVDEDDEADVDADDAHAPLDDWRRPGRPAPADSGEPHWARSLVEEINRPRPAAPAEPMHADPDDHDWRDRDHAPLHPEHTTHHAPHRAERQAPAHEEPSFNEMDFRDLMKSAMGDEDLIGSEPIELDEPAPRRRAARDDDDRDWPRHHQEHSALATIGWALACAVLALAAGAQLVWFRFDTLVKQPEWRPYFELACPALGCKVPPPYDIKLIQSSHLVVRSHPTVMGALIVDVDLTNNANIPQPFPLMHLSFSDMNGKVVAERVFKPAEYLAGELAGAHMMPLHQPVRISLDIHDPGPTALNYALLLYPAE